jgi:SNF2 family DNA or RNA helicase
MSRYNGENNLNPPEIYMNQKRLSAFNTLSDAEQQILLALAVYYAPIGQTALQDLLKRSAVFAQDLYNSISKPLREKFQQADLIVIGVEGWQCQPDMVEQLMRQAVKQPWFNKLATFLLADKQQPHYYSQGMIIAQSIKKIRLYLYLGDEVALMSELLRVSAVNSRNLFDIGDKFFFNDFDAEWFATVPENVRAFILCCYLDNNLYYFTEYRLQYALLEQYFGAEQPDNLNITHTLLEQRLLRGDFKDMEDWLAGDDSLRGIVIAASLRFLQHRYDEAVELFNDGLKLLKKETGKRNVYLEGLSGCFFNLALLARLSSTDLLLRQNALYTVKDGPQDAFYTLNWIFLDAVDMYQGRKSVDNCVYLFTSNRFAYERLFQALLLYWIGEIETITTLNSKFLPELAAFCKQADQLGFVWYAAASSALLQRLAYADEVCNKIAKQHAGSDFNRIVDLLPQVAKWQRALDALSQLKPGLAGDAVHQEVRMIWSVSVVGSHAALEPKEQKMGKSGRWTKGRPVALKRLAQAVTEFPYLSDQDQRICAHIQLHKNSDYYYGYPKETYELADEAILAAAGHPHVYWSDQEGVATPVDIKVAEPQLLVKEEEQQNLRISLLPKIGTEKIIAEKTANNGLLLYKINDQHRQVAGILGKEGLSVPASARQQVIDSIAAIASMLTVQSDIGGSSSFAETVEVDSRLHVHLQPVGPGLQIDVFVQPFANGGPLYKPGVGGTTVLAEIDGKQLQTSRDFKLEKGYLQQLLEACAGLYADKEAKWLLDDAEIALEVLLELQALGDFVLLEWPKGKKIQLSNEAGLSSAQFSVRKEKDWFSVEGSLQLDEQQVLDMQQLMRLLSSSPGRFLKLEDGQIIALTRELRQRLDDMLGLGELQKDQLRFHPLAAQALDDMTSGMSITASKPWLAQLRSLQEMGDLQPVVPSTLQGELRDYQREGYQWLTRLAYWGAGACLADDMGLGKTVQALALILSRAPNGPTLILAPTSVCINWLEESQRFAPTLNVYQFGSGDRQTMLDEAGPFDLIVCSYGLLQTEGERLAQKQWQTLVADEAQAFKNALTKRSKAVMALQADFKMITTGTPIENHLGELWNLFNFINPGLLGSLPKFNERFALPIESRQDAEVQQRLRKLLRPFILRRMKNDVLTELPARTEVTLHVDLSPEERTFYEALRRNAMQALLENTAQPGAQHLKVLAEIMKLRRACCHPQLVMAESTVASSKLAAFAELIDELLENRHKALVFSQFVGHLTLIRELLDKKGIRYHYLDGSTPVAQRKLAMNAFQAGEGDLFLISLKAGGTGLNLTAADYVIHMDPWWNPAVEDQASDRAHRMGQKRPVTIYRLVAKDTIEDKIVELHKHKRDLANSLLEGGEVSGSMSVEDMLALIREVG